MRKSKKEERLGTELINTDGIKLKCIDYVNSNNITVEAQILINDKIHKEIIKNKQWQYFNHLNENKLSTMRVIRITVDNVDYKLCCKCHKWKITDEFHVDLRCKDNKSPECIKCKDEDRQNKNTDWKYEREDEVKFNNEFKDKWIYLASCYKKYDKFIKARCVKCNKLNDKRLCSYKQSVSCSNCSDGISIPNKILRQISIQFNLDWKFEVREKIKDKEYQRDAYDKNYKLIVEMDGCYGNHTEKYHDERDKYFLSLGEYTIRINLMDKKKYSKNTLEYIKEQISKSNLPQVLYYVYGIDFNNFNWNEAWINCQNSLCINSWELWSKGFGVDYISKELKMDKTTVRRWLKRGKKSGIINYSEKESRDRVGTLYKVIDQYKNEMYLYGNKVWNANGRKGFLDLSFKMFQKYIEPYGIININKIEEGTFTNALRKKLAPFNGTRFIKIETYSMKQLENLNQQTEKSNLPLVLDHVHGIDFDLNEVWRYCQNSLCVKSWGLWRKGFGIGYISKELKVYRRTVSKWLNIGKKCGIINYSEKEAIERRGNVYRVIDQYKNEMYLYANKVWNANGHKGFLDLEHTIFKKYIEPYGIIDINKIESDIYKKRLAPFNGTKFIKIN